MKKRHITNRISQSFGKFASRKFSKPVQSFINKKYVKWMGLDMSDFDEPSSYETLNALFTRKLKNKRTFDEDEYMMISPCDAWISECGSLDGFDALQIKGMSYDVREFLTPHIDSEAHDWLDNGDYVNFYLSPKDYHRYHVPLDMTVTKAIHVPGKLYPVNVKSLEKRLNLFIENERVVLECQSDNDSFYLVLVGALNVGQMTVSFEPAIETNTQTDEIKVYEYSNVELKKGEELGYFKMGSTIILIAEKEMLDLYVNQNDNVKFGQTIARVK
jgi:phosphatidylserine decarboxylase